jgi:hypothetical protein
LHADHPLARALWPRAEPALVLGVDVIARAQYAECYTAWETHLIDLSQTLFFPPSSELEPVFSCRRTLSKTLEAKGASAIFAFARDRALTPPLLGLARRTELALAAIAFNLDLDRRLDANFRTLEDTASERHTTHRND